MIRPPGVPFSHAWKEYQSRPSGGRFSRLCPRRIPLCSKLSFSRHSRRLICRTQLQVLETIIPSGPLGEHHQLFFSKPKQPAAFTVTRVPPRSDLIRRLCVDNHRSDPADAFTSSQIGCATGLAGTASAVQLNSDRSTQVPMPSWHARWTSCFPGRLTNFPRSSTLGPQPKTPGPASVLECVQMSPLASITTRPYRRFPTSSSCFPSDCPARIPTRVRSFRRIAHPP